MYNKPEKFIFIWHNGNISHILANSVLHASEYAQQIYGFVGVAHIIHRPIVDRDFQESNIVILDGIRPCDVTTMPLQNLIGIFSRTKLK